MGITPDRSGRLSGKKEDMMSDHKHEMYRYLVYGPRGRDLVYVWFGSAAEAEEWIAHELAHPADPDLAPVHRRDFRVVDVGD